MNNPASLIVSRIKLEADLLHSCCFARDNLHDSARIGEKLVSGPKNQSLSRYPVEVVYIFWPFEKSRPLFSKNTLFVHR